MVLSELTLQEKIETIKDFIVSYDLSSYEISKNTKISIFGIESILNGKTKKPRKTTLDKILNYLNSLNKTKNKDNELKEEYTVDFRNRNAAETGDHYQLNFKDLKIDDKLNIINEKLDLLLNSKS